MENFPFFTASSKILALAEKAQARAASQFAQINTTQRWNQQKMLAAFQRARVSESCFAASTGYGYDDRGRDVLDEVYAQAFGAEDALVRYNFVSGTHALTVALFGVLRPGDTVLCATGTPYDTIQGVFGLPGREEPGCLKEFGVVYEQVDLLPDGTPDYAELEREIASDCKMVYIQRSRGYSLRPSMSVAEIEKLAAFVKKKAPGCIVMVDNCYGEFIEREEPVARGADLMAGSLIKNPGGGVAPTGGYIAGRKDLVELCSYRLTTPGTGRELGCTLGHNRELFMGAFHAPYVAGEALKTAVFASALFSELGFAVTPTPEEARTDIIQAIELRSREALIAFCRGIQKASPVDAFVVPEPSPMPGYDSDVIMAAGAFTLGSSIELSADGPLREPYAVWMQGGLNYPSGELGVLLAAEELEKAGLV